MLNFNNIVISLMPAAHWWTSECPGIELRMTDALPTAPLQHLKERSLLQNKIIIIFGLNSTKPQLSRAFQVSHIF